MIPFIDLTDRYYAHMEELNVFIQRVYIASVRSCFDSQ